jgi:teichoic acid transport system permease protein
MSADTHPKPDTGLPEPQPPEFGDDPTEAHPELRRVGVKLPLRDYIREVWRRREFAVTVPMGELRANNQDTALGQLWHLLNPLLLVGVYYFVFGVILQIDERRGMDIDDYLQFLIVGVLTFNFTRSSVRSGARMIVKNRKLVQSINFPRAILPASAMVSETLSHFWAVPVMFAMLLFAGGSPNWGWFLIVPIVVLQAMFNLGIAMTTARLAFHFRDLQNLLPYLLRIWFYMSGVLYPVNPDLFPWPAFRIVMEINPAYAIVQASRDAFLDGVIDPYVWTIMVSWAVIGLLFGFWYFRRAENEYGRV